MPFIDKTLGAVLGEQARLHPEKEFLVYSDRGLRFTYRQFDERVKNMAKGLLAMGLRRGDHAGVWATNVPDWLTIFFVREYPITGNGKVQKYKLREMSLELLQKCGYQRT
jgi:acyl-CoA synthetase (AMP-forming)/AMP-acid ligase II